MVQERNAAVDFSGLEETFLWLKARKNVLVGAALVVVLGIAMWAFVGRQIQASRIKPWKQVLTSIAPPWAATPEDIAAAREKVKNTPAEPYALYWEGLRLFEGNNSAGALERLQTLSKDFATHPLCTVGLADPNRPETDQTPVARMIGEMRRLQDWAQKYPIPQSNPMPKPLQMVGLVTDRGPIVLALYSDLAPKTCDAFVMIAPQLKDKFIGKAQPAQWIEIGQDADGLSAKAADVSEGFPPFEANNGLWHFPGTVSLRQAPFTKGPFTLDLRVMLKTDFNEDGRSTVFAQIKEGQELLETLAKEEQKKDRPTQLATPLKIIEVKIETVSTPK